MAEDHVVVRSAVDATHRATGLGAIVYRSRADKRLSTARLGELLATARSRNAREGLSGLLLFDGTHFLQWLEGPVDALRRVWSSIQADPRHSELELIGRPDLPVRLFRGWDMGLAGPSRGIAEGIDDVVLVDQAFFEQLEGAGASLAGLLELLARVAPTESVLSTAPRVDEREEHVRVLCLDHVLPIVEARHGLPVDQPVSRRAADARLPRIDPAFIRRFADHLRASDHEAAERVWRRLVSLGCSPASLCSDLVEPTARRLGDLWAQDSCSGADLAIAETELLLLLRRDTSPAAPRARLRQPKVLVSAMPGAHNVLGPALAAARLESMQCCTECLHPETDDELDVRLVETDTHNLVIALDPVHGLSVDADALDRTVKAAREAMHNRGLRVMLYGRQVAEDPGIGKRAHADSAYATLSELNVDSMEWSSL
ncbi:MAG: BLUF domain-containing protein [Pseudomonadales bacterium]|jgi:hypothetical protein|nr:BLUF domain-containing protein [Pseudomonadales bacterium]